MNKSRLFLVIILTVIGVAAIGCRSNASDNSKSQFQEDSRSFVLNGKKEKKEAEAEALPNYQSHPESPMVKDLGVQIKLSKTSSRPGEPMVLRGAYKIDQKFARKAEGVPLTRLMLIVIRRDELGIWHGVVQEGHNIMPEPSEPGQRDDPDYREGGYFNLDLTSICKMIAEPGYYWVLASMGDAVSDRIEFEILSK